MATFSVAAQMNSNGTSTGRKSLCATAKLTSLSVACPIFPQHTAAYTVYIRIGFINWATETRDGDEYTLKTITVPANISRAAVTETFSNLSYHCQPGHTIYGRIDVTGSDKLKKANFTFSGNYDAKTQPTVTAGSSTITKAQINSLEYYKSSSRTPKMLIKDSTIGRVIYNSDVGAISGYTAISSAPGQNTSITASWYNSR